MRTPVPLVARRLFALASPFAARWALTALLGAATAASGLGLMTTSAYLLARAALHPSIAALQVAIVGVRFFGITRGVLRYLERLVAHETTFRLLTRLRTWFYAALEPLAPARLDALRGGDLLARAVADVETLENFFLRALAPPVVAVLSAAVAIGLVAGVDTRLGALLAAFLVVTGAGLPLLAWATGRAPGRRLVSVRAELNATLVDTVQGAGDLLAAGAAGRQVARIEHLGRELGALQGRLAAAAGLHDALGGLAVNLATAAVVAVGIPLVRSGQMDGVLLAVVSMAAISAFEAVLPLPPAFQYLGASLAAAGRLFEVVDVPPAVVDPAVPASPPARGALRASTGPVLHVQDLSFTYEPGGPAVLRDVSLSVSAGGLVAVVGPSGAGKSTLVHLLLRFWDYSQGQIQLGGRELHAYAAADVRDLFAVVSQHTHLFTGTVRDNLALARPDASDDMLVGAARQARIHDFILSLTGGYDTWIGEQGVRLSAGQRRRLAIARAILQDAPLLLLDEPTANLDALTEREVMDSLLAHARGRTTLLVTHHLVGLEAADEILVLRAGQVVERGRHHDLLQMGGYYRRMWDVQHDLLVDR
ncbi:MAG: thiol reductant ABC exporter subunit CydC [Anaerolineae bacterium]|nr:thiol reductant ABC exporter subunit CydC [Anaerolineae bacterium]